MEHEEFLQNARFPMGEGGREILARMRDSHTDVTTWTLQLLDAQGQEQILDIGCGGGRALKRLSPAITTGKLYGIDYAETAVACTKEENAADVASGKLTVVQGSVSELPFPADTFDKIFSIESYYFWPDLQKDVKEILRVLRPGGRVFITADIHDRPNLSQEVLDTIDKLHMTNLSFAAFAQVLEQAGYVDVVIHGKDGTDWMCAEGRKPEIF